MNSGSLNLNFDVMYAFYTTVSAYARVTPTTLMTSNAESNCFIVLKSMMLNLH